MRFGNAPVLAPKKEKDRNRKSTTILVERKSSLWYSTNNFGEILLQPFLGEEDPGSDTVRYENVSHTFLGLF